MPKITELPAAGVITGAERIPFVQDGVTVGGLVSAIAALVLGDLAGVLNFRSAFNASGNVFPSTGGSGSAGAIKKGDLWICSVAGTLGGTAVAPGDWILAKVDAPGSTLANWALIEHDIGYLPANDALVLHLGGSPESVTKQVKFDARPYTSDMPEWSGIPVNGTAASTAWAALDGVHSDQNILNVRNSQNILVDVDLTLTVIPPKVARGGMITVAAGKTLTIPAGFDCGPWQCFDTTASGAHVVFMGTPVVRPEWWGVKPSSEGGSTDQMPALERCRADVKLANTGGQGPTVVLWRDALSYRLYSNLATVLDSRREVHKGLIPGGVKWDMSGLPDGGVWAKVIQNAADGGHVQSSVLENIWVVGPSSAKTTASFLMLGDGAGGQCASADFAYLFVTGFYDQVQWNSNAFLNSFTKCALGFGAARHALYVLPGSTNVGENERFWGGAITGARIALETSNITASQFTFFGTSIDYNDIAFIMDRGEVNMVGAHLEDSPRGTGTDIYRITDGATQSGVAQITSAGLFTFVAGLDDTGVTQRNVVHANFPAGTKITGIVDDHTATTNTPATATGSGLSVVCCADQSIYMRGDHGGKFTASAGTSFFNNWAVGQRAAIIKNTDLGTNNNGSGGGFNASFSFSDWYVNPTVCAIPFGIDNSVYSPLGYSSVAGTRLSSKGMHYTQQAYGSQYPMRWVTREGTVILLDADIEHTANPKQLVASGYPWRTRPRLESYPKVHAKDRFQLVAQRLYLVRISPNEGLAVGASQAANGLFDAALAGSGITNGRMAWYTAGVPTSTTLGRVGLFSQFLSVTADAENTVPRALGSSPPVEPWVEQYMGVYVDATVTPELWGMAATRAKSGWGMNAPGPGPMGGYIDLGATNPPSTIAKASILDPDFLPWLALVPTTT